MKFKRLFAFAAAAALTLSLFACGKKNVYASPTTNETPGAETSAPVSPTPSVLPETASPVSPSPVLPSPSPEISVKDFCRNEGKYTDSVGNTTEYSYVLPLVEGVDSSYIESVNKEIEALYNDYIVPELVTMKTGYSVMTISSDYESCTRDGVFSLMVFIHNDWDMTGYYCWNIAADGSEITNSELLKTLGVTEQEFTDKARDLMSERVAFDPDTVSDSDMKETLADVRDRTLAADNCNADMPMHIDCETGKLCFVARIYSIAGAEYYYYVFNIEI